MRVVVDTNVVISALISRTGAPAHVIDAWLSGRFDWVTSDVLLTELSRAMGYPRVRKASAWPEHRRLQFLEQLHEQAIIVRPDAVITASRDADDNRVLEAAVAGDADAIVSGDADLLALGEFEGIPVVTPAGLLSMLRLEP